MMITSTSPVSGSREISIGLDSNDAIAIMGEESWNAMSFKERIDWLQKRTDMEVLIYLFKEKYISAEYLQERVKEIKAR